MADHIGALSAINGLVSRHLGSARNLKAKAGAKLTNADR
jgi:hypothetical protein